LILHYNGAEWVRDSAAEALLGFATMFFAGRASDDVYFSSYYTGLVHFDGTELTRVDPAGLFAVPDGFGDCTDTDPGAACSGSGISFGPLSVAPTGTLFASVYSGVYEVEADEDAGCAVGQYRCIITPVPSTSLQVARFDGATWSVEPVVELEPDDMRYFGDVWAAADDRAYVVLWSYDETHGEFNPLTEVFTWDGLSWTSLEEQPSLGIALLGFERGDLYALGAANVMERYQSCDE
jgi:hypothetical protein